MTQQLYKPFTPDGPYPLSMLEGAKFCTLPLPEPEMADVPEGEWYCTNPECVVRECTIRCKLYGEPLPDMECPACAEPLKFHHWIGHETLVPA